MIIVSAVVFALYGVFLLAMVVGWTKGVSSKLQEKNYQTAVSVVVPVRNEAENIGNLLHDLLTQDYENFEVIVVDDHSDDSTVSIANTLQDKRLKVITNAGTGKKAAITTAVKVAKHDIIVTTDGDCRISNEWLRNIAAHFHSEKVKMVLGSVVMENGGALFARMQQIEFVSLIGTAAASVELGFPSMCNGANLAFRKSMFVEVNGYSGNEQIASGDDEFLMRKIVLAHPRGLTFNYGAPVITKAQSSVSSFLSQRIRWASKWKHNSSIAVKLLAFFIFVVQLVFVYSLFKAGMGSSNYLGFVIVKMVLELGVITLFARHLNIRVRLFPFMVLQLVYPLYVTLVAILSFFVSYSWKGRQYAKA